MTDTADKSILAYRYRLYPTKAQASALAETLETCRQVYNSLLNWRKHDYEMLGKSPSKFEQQAAFPRWKKDHAELLGVFSQVLQNVAVRVDLAFDAFFRRVREGETPGFPRVKGKGQYDSITYPQAGFEFHQGKLRLSKIGDINIRLHRPIEGIIKTCTIRRINGKWFVCLSCTVGPELLPPSEEEIGIDVGIRVFAALSNGEFIENPRFFRKDEKALAKAQRKLCKQKRGSKARKKARKVVSRIHERVRNRRHDFVHQTARRLVNRYGVIAVEGLNVKNMTRRPKAKPDPENVGQYLPNGASAKAGLNKSIADASWSMFRNVLTMKAERAARLVVAINPAYTSQMCSGCGNIVKKTLNEREHRCLVCDLVMDRDTNASVNILAAVGQHSLAALAA